MMCRTQSATVFHAALLAGALLSGAGAASSHSRVLLGSASRGRAAGAAASSARAETGSVMVKAGPPTDSERMEYVVQMLDKFKAFAAESRVGIEERHQAEQERLLAALPQTADKGTRQALNESITSNVASLVETRRTYNNMVNFATSMLKFLKVAVPGGRTCGKASCGAHASCTASTLGPQCVCSEGYVGNGQDCAAPPEFMPHQLLFEGAGGLETQAADMHVTLFGKSNIAVAFVDMSRGSVGRAVVGHVREAGMAMLAPPESFTVSRGKAFSPVVAGTEGKRILVTWRDENIGGRCWMRAAVMGDSEIRGAGQHLTWGEPVDFCRGQAQKMAAVPLPGNRVAVLYADKINATAHTPEENFGNSMLVALDDRGAATQLGTYRFADVALCRLEVTKLTPKTFVIAARGAEAVDDLGASVPTSNEAMAVYGELSGDDLVYDPNTLSLAPNVKNIWARGVSLIAPNTFAYAYQQGTDLKMMLSVVRVNATTHRMEVLEQPKLLKNGFSPYVGMLSVPYTAADPHSLAYYQVDDKNMVNVCSWDQDKSALSRCQEYVWLQGKTRSMSGVHLGGGKSFMVFAPESGVPYYGVFGLAKK